MFGVDSVVISHEPPIFCLQGQKWTIPESNFLTLYFCLSLNSSNSKTSAESISHWIREQVLFSRVNYMNDFDIHRNGRVASNIFGLHSPPVSPVALSVECVHVHVHVSLMPAFPSTTGVGVEPSHSVIPRCSVEVTRTHGHMVAGICGCNIYKVECHSFLLCESTQLSKMYRKSDCRSLTWNMSHSAEKTKCVMAECSWRIFQFHLLPVIIVFQRVGQDQQQNNSHCIEIKYTNCEKNAPNPSARSAWLVFDYANYVALVIVLCTRIDWRAKFWNEGEHYRKCKEQLRGWFNSYSRVFMSEQSIRTYSWNASRLSTPTVVSYVVMFICECGFSFIQIEKFYREFSAFQCLLPTNKEWKNIIRILPGLSFMNKIE